MTSLIDKPPRDSRPGLISHGYNLESIGLSLEKVPTGAGTLVVTVHENVSGDLPSETVLYTLTNPGTFRTGLNEFTAPANAELSASTHYWVRASYSSPIGAPELYRGSRLITANQIAAPGWSIVDAYRARSIALKRGLGGAGDNPGT